MVTFIASAISVPYLWYVSLKVSQPDRWLGEKSIYNSEKHSFICSIWTIQETASLTDTFLQLQIDKGRLSLLYFLADVTGTPFDRKYVYVVVDTRNQCLMYLSGRNKFYIAALVL